MEKRFRLIRPCGDERPEVRSSLLLRHLLFAPLDLVDESPQHQEPKWPSVPSASHCSCLCCASSRTSTTNSNSSSSNKHHHRKPRDRANVSLHESEKEQQQNLGTQGEGGPARFLRSGLWLARLIWFSTKFDAPRVPRGTTKEPPTPTHMYPASQSHPFLLSLASPVPVSSKARKGLKLIRSFKSNITFIPKINLHQTNKSKKKHLSSPPSFNFHLINFHISSSTETICRY